MVRSAALSFACSMARLGSMLAPFIALLSTVHPVLPIFVFGSINFVMGVQVSCGWWTVDTGHVTTMLTSDWSRPLLCPRQTTRSSPTLCRKGSCT